MYAMMIRSLKSELEEIIVFASPVSIPLTSGNSTLIFLWGVTPPPFRIHVVQVIYFMFQILAQEADRLVSVGCYWWWQYGLPVCVCVCVFVCVCALAQKYLPLRFKLESFCWNCVKIYSFVSMIAWVRRYKSGSLEDILLLSV